MLFAYAKTKVQISYQVTAHLIMQRLCFRYIDSTISLHILNLKFQASGHLLWLYTAWFVADFVRNVKGRLSHGVAHVVLASQVLH